MISCNRGRLPFLILLALPLAVILAGCSESKSDIAVAPSAGRVAKATTIASSEKDPVEEETAAVRSVSTAAGASRATTGGLCPPPRPGVLQSALPEAFGDWTRTNIEISGSEAHSFDAVVVRARYAREGDSLKITIGDLTPPEWKSEFEESMSHKEKIERQLEQLSQKQRQQMMERFRGMMPTDSTYRGYRTLHREGGEENVLELFANERFIVKASSSAPIAQAYVAVDAVDFQRLEALAADPALGGSDVPPGAQVTLRFVNYNKTPFTLLVDGERVQTVEAQSHSQPLAATRDQEVTIRSGERSPQCAARPETLLKQGEHALIGVLGPWEGPQLIYNPSDLSPPTGRALLVPVTAGTAGFVLMSDQERVEIAARGAYDNWYTPVAVAPRDWTVHTPFNLERGHDDPEGRIDGDALEAGRAYAFYEGKDFETGPYSSKVGTYTVVPLATASE